MDQELTTYLSQFVTPQRLARMQEVLAERTRYLTVVLEDIYQPHNASAVLRSCDSCGVQDVHIIEKRNNYRVNPGVELGTAQWLTLHKYKKIEGTRPESAQAPGGDTPQAPGSPDPPPPGGDAVRRAENPVTAAISDLRSRGYRIIATTPHTDDVELGSFDLRRGKVALCFGTEMEGLSEELLAEADAYLRIPMYGFVESFNISVSAAITLYTLTQRLRRGEYNAAPVPWRISEDERRELLLTWLRRSVKASDRLIERFRRRGDGA